MSKRVKLTSTSVEDVDQLISMLASGDTNAIEQGLLALRIDSSAVCDRKVLDGDETLAESLMSASLCLKYAVASPTLAEIFSLLKNEHQRKGKRIGWIFETLSLLLDALGVVADTIVGSACKRIKTSVARKVIVSELKVIHNVLKSGQFSKIRPALRLLRSVAVTSTTAARELFTMLQVDTLSKLSDARAKRSSTELESNHEKDVRHHFVRLVVAFLEMGDQRMLEMLMEKQHGLLRLALKGMSSGPFQLTADLLRAIKDNILIEQQLQRKTKTRFFSGSVLGQFALLLRSLVGDAEKESFVADYCIDLTTSRSYGICFPENFWRQRNEESEKQRSRNDHVLPLLRGLRPSESFAQQRVIYAVLERSPRLLSNYLQAVSYSFEPRPSVRWLQSCRFLRRLLLSLTVPGPIPTDTDEGSVDMLGLHLVPAALSSKQWMAGLKHELHLIQMHTLLVLDAMLTRAGKYLYTIADDSTKHLLSFSLSDRLPNHRFVVSLSRGILSSANETMMNVACLNVLRGYRDCLSVQLTAGKLDQELFSDMSKWTASPWMQLPLVRYIGGQNSSPQWWSPNSPRILSLLRLYIESTDNTVTRTTKAMLIELILSTELFRGCADEVEIWISALYYIEDCEFFAQLLCDSVANPTRCLALTQKMIDICLSLDFPVVSPLSPVFAFAVSQPHGRDYVFRVLQRIVLLKPTSRRVVASLLEDGGILLTNSGPETFVQSLISGQLPPSMSGVSDNRFIDFLCLQIINGNPDLSLIFSWLRRVSQHADFVAAITLLMNFCDLEQIPLNVAQLCFSVMSAISERCDISQVVFQNAIFFLRWGLKDHFALDFLMNVCLNVHKNMCELEKLSDEWASMGLSSLARASVPLLAVLPISNSLNCQLSEFCRLCTEPLLVDIVRCCCPLRLDLNDVVEGFVFKGDHLARSQRLLSDSLLLTLLRRFASAESLEAFGTLENVILQELLAQPLLIDTQLALQLWSTVCSRPKISLQSSIIAMLLTRGSSHLRLSLINSLSQEVPQNDSLLRTFILCACENLGDEEYTLGHGWRDGVSALWSRGLISGSWLMKMGAKVKPLDPAQLPCESWALDYVNIERLAEWIASGDQLPDKYESKLVSLISDGAWEWENLCPLIEDVVLKQQRMSAALVSFASSPKVPKGWLERTFRYVLQHWNSPDENVWYFLLLVAQDRPVICDEATLGRALSLYGATCSSADKMALRLIHAHNLPLFNDSTVSSFYDGQLLQEATLIRSSRKFPVLRSVDSGGDDALVYDPLFVLPLILYVVSNYQINCSALAQSGALAYCLAALGAKEETVRRPAYNVIAYFTQELEIAHFRSRAQLLSMLNAVRNAITIECQCLSSIVAGFLARASLICCRPDHFLYEPICRYFAKKPIMDINDCPLFFAAFLGNNVDDSRRARLWYLKVIGSCCKRGIDLKLLLRRHVVDLALARYNTLADAGERDAVVQFLLTTTGKDSHIAYTMQKKCNVVAWLLTAQHVSVIAFAQLGLRFLRAAPRRVGSSSWHLAMRLLPMCSSPSEVGLCFDLLSASVVQSREVATLTHFRCMMEHAKLEQHRRQAAQIWAACLVYDVEVSRAMLEYRTAETLRWVLHAMVAGNKQPYIPWDSVASAVVDAVCKNLLETEIGSILLQICVLFLRLNVGHHVELGNPIDREALMILACKEMTHRN